MLEKRGKNVPLQNSWIKGYQVPWLGRAMTEIYFVVYEGSDVMEKEGLTIRPSSNLVMSLVAVPAK